MNVSILHKAIRKHKVPVVQILRPGDLIQAGDLIVNDCFFESPSDTSVGKPCGETEAIIRFTYNV